MALINSISTYLDHIIEGHLHGEEYWIPLNDLTTAFQISTNGVNIFGAWVSIINPVTVPSLDFHRFIMVNPLLDPIPADGVYQVEVGVGAPGAQVAITRTEFYVDTAVAGNLPRTPKDIMCPRIYYGSRIWARVRCNLAPIQTLNLRFGYHVYSV